MVTREACPQCGSRRYKRNGHIHTGKQNHRCKVCGRAFVLTPENALITEEQLSLIERLLLGGAFQVMLSPEMSQKSPVDSAYCRLPFARQPYLDTTTQVCCLQMKPLHIMRNLTGV